MREKILEELREDDRQNKENSDLVLILAEMEIYPDGIVLKHENKRIAAAAVDAVLAGS